MLRYRNMSKIQTTGLVTRAAKERDGPRGQIHFRAQFKPQRDQVCVVSEKCEAGVPGARKALSKQITARDKMSLLLDQATTAIDAEKNSSRRLFWRTSRCNGHWLQQHRCGRGRYCNSKGQQSCGDGYYYSHISEGNGAKFDSSDSPSTGI